MQRSFLVKFFTILLLGFFTNAQAQNDEHEGSPEEVSLKTKIKESIDHHLLDSYDFIFFSDTEKNKHYGFPLPVILWDDGFHLFSSSKFHHGETVAENNGNFYKLYHNKIYKIIGSKNLPTPVTIGPLLKDFAIPANAKNINIPVMITIRLFDYQKCTNDYHNRNINVFSIFGYGEIL